MDYGGQWDEQKRARTAVITTQRRAIHEIIICCGHNQAAWLWLASHVGGSLERWVGVFFAPAATVWSRCLRSRLLSSSVSQLTCGSRSVMKGFCGSDTVLPSTRGDGAGSPFVAKKGACCRASCRRRLILASYTIFALNSTFCFLPGTE